MPCMRELTGDESNAVDGMKDKMTNNRPVAYQPALRTFAGELEEHLANHPTTRFFIYFGNTSKAAVDAREKSTLSELIAAANDQSSQYLRLAAIITIRSIGRDASSALKPVLRALEDDFLPVVRESIIAIDAIRPPAKYVVRSLARTLQRAPQWEDHADGCWTDEIGVLISKLLAHYGAEAKPGLSALIGTLRSGSRAAHCAAHAIGEMGPVAKAALPALLEATKSDRYEIYIASAYALSILDPSAVVPLVPGLVDKIAGLWPIDENPDRYIERRIDMALSEHPRFYAAATLKNLGHLAQEAVPGLTRILADEPEHSLIKSAISNALSAIVGGGKVSLGTKPKALARDLKNISPSGRIRRVAPIENPTAGEPIAPLDELDQIEHALTELQTSLVVRFQRLLDKISGQNYPSFDTKSAIVSRINQLARRFKIELLHNGKPCTLRCFKTARTEGVFQLQTGGKAIYGRVKFPELATRLSETDTPTRKKLQSVRSHRA
jgi:hypothetical protein